MTVFEVLQVLCAICGLAMVVGGLYLLRVGAVTLNQASADSALDVAIADSVKISTSYPGLGLFVIGAIFTGMALYAAYPKEIKKVNVVGTPIAEDAEDFSSVGLALCAGPWLVPVYQNGKIIHEMAPTYGRLKVHVYAPGFEVPVYDNSVTFAEKEIDIGEIDLGKQMTALARLTNSEIEEYREEDLNSFDENLPQNKY